MSLCSDCHRPASRVRKGRCNACYMRLYRRGEIPDGAACAACAERRKAVLVHTTVGVLCGNCAVVLDRARAAGLDELRRLMIRERRAAPRDLSPAPAPVGPTPAAKAF